MKKERHNFNKNCRLDKVCEGDGWRPAYSLIYFRNGYAYATNAHICIRVKLTAISSFHEINLETLEEKAIHYSLFAKLLLYSRVEITPEGFKAKIPDAGGFITFGFAEYSSKVPDDIDKILLNSANEEKTEFKSFGISPVLLNTLNNVINSHGVALTVKAPNKAILIKWTDVDATGLIMPVMINE